MKKSVMLMLGLLLASSAQAAEIGVLGGANLSRMSQDVTPATYNTVLDYSFGASFYASSLIPIPGFGLELDALIMNRKVETQVPIVNNKTTQQQRYVMIPAIIRFSALPIVSIGAGPYVAPTMGKGTANGVEQTTEAATDYGLVGSLKFQLPLAPLTSLVADARYIYGLSDIREGADQKFRDVQVLGGISFGF